MSVLLFIHSIGIVLFSPTAKNVEAIAEKRENQMVYLEGREREHEKENRMEEEQEVGAGDKWGQIVEYEERKKERSKQIPFKHSCNPSKTFNCCSSSSARHELPYVANC